MSDESQNDKVVFLSHSSRDRDRAIALKKLLDDRFGQAVEFFLSSDGQSLRLGKNWVAEISKALERAKLMFLFLSRNSWDSLWVHFEAGNVYGRGRVIPVCMPGFHVHELKPPLSLLQAFNLHAPAALGNLVEECNHEFKLKMPIAFKPEDFHTVFGLSEAEEETFFRQWTPYVTGIDIDGAVRSPIGQPLDIPLEMAKEYGAREPQFEPRIGLSVNGQNRQIDAPGGFLRQKFDGQQDGFETYTVTGRFSPLLFHIHADALNQWYVKQKHDRDLRLHIHLSDKVQMDYDFPAITAKLFGSPVRNLTAGRLLYAEIEFTLFQGAVVIMYRGKADALTLSNLLSTLFLRQVCRLKADQ